MRKPGKRMASVIASIAAVCVMTGGIGYQAAVSGAQTDSTESSVKDQNTDQQEMNREANTILSKTNDLAISDIGISLKTDIEKVREQIQNIE